MTTYGLGSITQKNGKWQWTGYEKTEDGKIKRPTKIFHSEAEAIAYRNDRAKRAESAADPTQAQTTTVLCTATAAVCDSLAQMIDTEAALSPELTECLDRLCEAWLREKEKRAARELMSTVEERVETPDSHSARTVGDVYKELCVVKNFDKRKRSNWERHCKQFFENKPINSPFIDCKDFSDYLGNLMIDTGTQEEHASGKTKYLIWGTFKQIIDYAKDKEYCSKKIVYKDMKIPNQRT